MKAQDCPPNIDFEYGTFDRWNCHVGSVEALNGENLINLNFSGPVAGRHTMYTASAVPELDPYGNFPVICPNGSGQSIRLGNDLGGTEAEGVSYEFTIPANRNVYSLLYHYAVVFQDPAHLEYQQPRLVIEILNVTDNKIIDCSSLTFFPNGSPLPGFFLSPNSGSSTPVWCKDWSAVTINLNGYAGKTIRLFFKTADCTFRRHFGYAYIDVNSECSDEFVGATYCRDDSAVQVVAPYGYQQYTWYDNNFSRVLGRQQVLRFSPPPATGTTVAVEVIPYAGYGCSDTLYAKLVDTMTIKAFAGNDAVVCNGVPVQLGAPPKSGVVYHWSPQSGLTNPAVSNPFASPAMATTYVLTSSSYGGGCVDRDSVAVMPVLLDNTLQLLGQAAFCLDSEDSAVLRAPPADSIQWYRNGVAIAGANVLRYRVTQSGEYHAMLFDDSGCTVITRKQPVLIEKARPGITYPVVYALIDHPLSLKARQFGVTVLWRPATYLNTATSYTPLYTGGSDQTYTIEIKTSAGCITVDTLHVKAVRQVDILVPTAFTPNNDGRNDVLRPTLMGVKELRYFRVYNRWGELLFESKSEQQGWDGTFRGAVQGNQAVVWMAEGVGVDGKICFRKGTSICVR